MVECIQVVIIKKSMPLFLVFFFFLLTQTASVLGSWNHEDWDTSDLVLDNRGNTKSSKLKKEKPASNDTSDSTDSDANTKKNKIIFDSDNISLGKSTFTNSWKNTEAKKVDALRPYYERSILNEKNNKTNKFTDSNDPDEKKGPSQEIKDKIDRILSTNIDNSGDSSTREEPSPSGSKKYILIPTILLCFIYGAYKYIPWKKLTLSQKQARDFWSSIVPFLHKTTHTDKLPDTVTQDNCDTPVSDQKESDEEQKEVLIVEEENNEETHNAKLLDIPATLPTPSPKEPLGRIKSSMGTMRLLGSSLSATLLLACAAYLITTDNAPKKIEKNHYDTYRIYFRYAVAALVCTISAVLFFKISQNT